MKEKENQNKWNALKDLMSDKREFGLFAKKVSASQLDYQVLLKFLESVDDNVQNGARALLDTMEKPTIINVNHLTILKMFS